MADSINDITSSEVSVEEINNMDTPIILSSSSKPQTFANVFNAVNKAIKAFAKAIVGMRSNWLTDVNPIEGTYTKTDNSKTEYKNNSNNAKEIASIEMNGQTARRYTHGTVRIYMNDSSNPTGAADVNIFQTRPVSLGSAAGSTSSSHGGNATADYSAMMVSENNGVYIKLYLNPHNGGTSSYPSYYTFNTIKLDYICY